MNKHFGLVAGVAALALTLSGCASIIEGQSQTLSITTPNTTGANCGLSNSEGKYSVSSPGTVIVKRSKTNVQINCTQGGFQDASAIARSDFEPWTIGNIVFGGIPGLIIDWADGSINRYPDTVAVPMTRRPAAQTDGNVRTPTS